MDTDTHKHISKISVKYVCELLNRVIYVILVIILTTEKYWNVSVIPLVGQEKYKNFFFIILFKYLTKSAKEISDKHLHVHCI